MTELKQMKSVPVQTLGKVQFCTNRYLIRLVSADPGPIGVSVYPQDQLSSSDVNEMTLDH